MGCISSAPSNDVRPAQGQMNAGGASGRPGAAGGKMKGDAPGGPGGEEALDPRLPLNGKELFKLKSSWKAIHRLLMETGVELFICLFKREPALRDIFTQHRTLPAEPSLDELRDMEVLQQLAEKVMNPVDEAILNLENVDSVLSTMATVAAVHANLEGFQADWFWKFEEPFVEAVRIILDDRFSDYIADVYRKTFKFLIQSLVTAFEKSAAR